MAPTTPYSHHIEGRDPLVAMRETIPAIAQVVAGWTKEQFDRPIAPGKWTVGQILTHLAQTELALGTRARMALTRPGFTAQSFDQDGWLAREGAMSAADAVAQIKDGMTIGIGGWGPRCYKPRPALP